MAFMKMPIDGGVPEVLYSNPGWGVFQPRISPDGKHIAFGAYDMTTYQKRLQVASLNGYDFGKIERDMEYNLVSQFGWSPDGRELTILTSRNGTPNVWRQPIDGSAPTPITAFTSGRVFNFAWSADGKNLILARKYGQRPAPYPRHHSRRRCSERRGRSASLRFVLRSIDIGR